ncbi:MAG: hypothetical protein ACFE94_00570 [Candidatus Hodarchaeota archaeon]
MKIITYGWSLKWKAPIIVKKEIDLKCEGEGCEDNPFVIKPSSMLPSYFEIHNSEYYVDIQNCDLESIDLKHCRNVTFKDCKLKRSKLEGCSIIRYLNSNIYGNLTLLSCNEVKIEECIINKLKFKSSNSNLVKNCSINTIKKIRSKNNIFEEIINSK